MGGILFFCVCFPLSTLASRWEKKLKERDKQQVKAAVRKKPDDISDAELDEIIKQSKAAGGAE